MRVKWEREGRICLTRMGRKPLHQYLLHLRLEFSILFQFTLLSLDLLFFKFYSLLLKQHKSLVILLLSSTQLLHHIFQHFTTLSLRNIFLFLCGGVVERLPASHRLLEPVTSCHCSLLYWNWYPLYYFLRPH